jgi:UDP-glucose 4-epimerase
MRKVLITGSAGYIGQHLKRLLADSGYEVSGFDCVKGETYQGDVRIPSTLSRVNELYDTVIHLAALVRVNESIEMPYDYYDTNLNGTYNVMNHLRYTNFIYASTGAATMMNSPYALSKKCAEDVVVTKCPTPYTIFRFYNVTGRKYDINPTNPDGLFYNLLKAEQTGKFSIFGSDYNTDDGTAIRDYVHVMDICRAIEKAIVEPSNQIENLGTGIGYSVKEIADTFRKSNSVKFDIEYLPRRTGDAERTVLDKPSTYMLNSYKLEDLLKK